MSFDLDGWILDEAKHGSEGLYIYIPIPGVFEEEQSSKGQIVRDVS